MGLSGTIRPKIDNLIPMKIYSEAIHEFTHKCELYLQEIIKTETNLKFKRSRFELNKYTYPIHVVAFTQDQRIGYFDPITFHIGMNYSLIYKAKTPILKNILRHELAHYLCFIEYPNHTKAHGEEYQTICKRYGWSEKVSKATMDIEIENDNFEGDLKSEKIISKIKRLLTLAQSNNVHEAQLATLKANQLLIKYNIENIDLKSYDQVFVETVLKLKRRNAKMNTVYEILKNFLVRPVIIQGRGEVSLEVSGSKSNIELAKYVTSFLDSELDRLWTMTPLKGLKAKNSFFTGIAKGYDEKVSDINQSLTKKDINALVVINKNLDLNIEKIYKRLSSVSSNRSIDNGAFGLGKKAGKNLTITKAVKDNKITKLLNWR